ncbi:UNKNOWN [Stylonychia lemnae]|uniref:Uncharacterized protein n=1 Tax=Stylonychia lemnae TaxID=5949 RepID=A0A078A7H6_STYLE|nr:UNKNOWN [Stylonychia lemnae]|eukprot:CDW78199.1 UNKNOWN [Stylonychia lemnae]
MPQKSWEDAQLESKPKKCLRFITDLLKVGFGFGCFVKALVLAFEENKEIPALWETKMYYTFISLFLLLNGLDSLVDTFTDLLTFEKYPICVLVTNTVILLFYVPFVAIGFLMAKSRVQTSWADRQSAYVSYEIYLWKNNISKPNETNYEDLYARASLEASDFATSIRSDYLVFSILATLPLIQNFYQLAFICCDYRIKKICDGCLFMLGAGIATVCIIFTYQSVGDFFSLSPIYDEDGEVEDYDIIINGFNATVIPSAQLFAEGRYSKFAQQDYSLGIENMYTLIFTFNLIFEGLCKVLYESRCCTERCALLFNIFQVLFYLFISAFILYLLIEIGQNAELTFSNPTIMFYLSMVFDAVVHIIVTLIVTCACYVAYCKR